GSGCLSLMCRTRLAECHRRNECAAGENKNCLLDHEGLLCCCSRLRPLDVFLKLAVQHSLGRNGNKVVTNRRTTFSTADLPQMQSRVKTGGILPVLEESRGTCAHGTAPDFERCSLREGLGCYDQTYCVNNGGTLCGSDNVRRRTRQLHKASRK